MTDNMMTRARQIVNRVADFNHFAIPFPRADSSHGFCDRAAKRSVAVHDCDANLDLRDLSVEVPRHVALSDGLTIHVSRQSNDLDGVKAMINALGKLLVPERPSNRPRPEFLTWHRVNYFKH